MCTEGLFSNFFNKQTCMQNGNRFCLPPGGMVANVASDKGRKEPATLSHITRHKTSAILSYTRAPTTAIAVPLPPGGRLFGQMQCSLVKTNQIVISRHARLLLSLEMLMAPSCNRSRLSRDLPVPIATQDTASLATLVLIPVTCSTSWSKP